MVKDMQKKKGNVIKKPMEDKSLSAPADFTDPAALYQKLIDTVYEYRPGTDISMIEKAYKLAFELHKDQKRKSGEPYIIHPLCVAIILAELELDKETIIAGILHDVVEDTEYTIKDIEKSFGGEVAKLVLGVTKINNIHFSDGEKKKYEPKPLKVVFEDEASIQN